MNFSFRATVFYILAANEMLKDSESAHKSLRNPALSGSRRLIAACRLRVLFEETFTAMEPKSDVGSLQLGALGGRVGGQEPGDGNENPFSFGPTGPFPVLLDSRFYHLKGVKIGVFPDDR